MSDEPKTKEILYIVENWTILALIPKKRGDGFLRQPIGHHETPISRGLAQDLPFDCFGLDGYVEVDTGYTHELGSEKRARLVDLVISALSRHFGFPAREIEREKWFGYLIPDQENEVQNGFGFR